MPTRVGRSSALALGLIIVVTVVQLQASHYLTPSNIRVLAIQLVSLGIGALGSAFVVASGNIDISIGSMFSLCGVMASMAAAAGMPWPLALLMGPLMGAVLGGINGVMVHRLAVSPIVVTLGALTLYAGVVILITRGRTVAGVPQEFRTVGRGEFYAIPVNVLIFTGLALLAFAFANRIDIGRRLLAVGSNVRAAASVGIPIRKYVIGVFIVNGILVGLASTLSASRFGTAAPTAGIGYELQVLTAVLLGGVLFTGGVAPIGGVLLAVFLIGSIRSGLIAIGFEVTWTNVVIGALLIGAVALNQFSEERRERAVTRSALAEALEEDQEAGAADPGPPDSDRE